MTCDTFVQIVVIILSVVIFICFGIWVSEPDRVDDNCIVYRDKIYCEEINMEE